jgi:hypothetical protein
VTESEEYSCDCPAIGVTETITEQASCHAKTANDFRLADNQTMIIGRIRLMTMAIFAVPTAMACILFGKP